MEVIVKKQNGRLVAEVPTEALERLGVREGERLMVDSGKDTLSFRRVEIGLIVQEILGQDHAVLKKLAQSERMDMVDEIMEEYAEALEELAK